MRREDTFLYPAPPRKQPDETSGAPRRTAGRDSQVQGLMEDHRVPAENVNRAHAQDASTVGSRWDRGVRLQTSSHQDWLPVFTRQMSVLLLFSPCLRPILSTTSRTVIRHGPAQHLFLRTAFGASWPSGQRCKPTTGQLCLRKSSETPHTILHLWCSLWFRLKTHTQNKTKKQLTCFGWGSRVEWEGLGKINRHVTITS